MPKGLTANYDHFPVFYKQNKNKQQRILDLIALLYQL